MILARIQRAKYLLANSSLSVGQIAESLGYADIFPFSRQFKKKTGQSPRGFRAKQTHRAEPAESPLLGSIDAAPG